MQMRIVSFTVKPDQTRAFESATMAHVLESQKEPGIVRFEFLKQELDPTRFVLLIGFKDDQARDYHLALPHTHAWRATVTPLLLEPIKPIQYSSVPSDGDGRMSPRGTG